MKIEILGITFLNVAAFVICLLISYMYGIQHHQYFFAYLFTCFLAVTTFWLLVVIHMKREIEKIANEKEID